MLLFSFPKHCYFTIKKVYGMEKEERWRFEKILAHNVGKDRKLGK